MSLKKLILVFPLCLPKSDKIQIRPSLKSDITDLGENYTASRTIQKIRRSLGNNIQENDKDRGYEFSQMHESIKMRIESVLANSSTCKVKRYY